MLRALRRSAVSVALAITVVQALAFASGLGPELLAFTEANASLTSSLVVLIIVLRAFVVDAELLSQREDFQSRLRGSSRRKRKLRR